MGSLNTREKDVILMLAANPLYAIDLNWGFWFNKSSRIGENEK
tara:strand:- start:3354 stop:3482 length:129 start_codon:yes stop_codon:yes gene_type:complete